jgi:hypothetical protein
MTICEKYGKVSMDGTKLVSSPTQKRITAKGKATNIWLKATNKNICNI